MDYKPKIKLSQDEFRVLASNTRIDILKLLDESQLTVSDVSRRLEMNKATVHEHLTKLIEVGLVKKEDSPRKWVYYKLTWKGRNLLHPERVRVMVSLALITMVIVIGALLVAYSTPLLTPDGTGDDPPIDHTTTNAIFKWDPDTTDADEFDITFDSSTGVRITNVKDLSFFIESGPTTISRSRPIDLDWSLATDIIHIYDFDHVLDDYEDEYLFVEGTVMDNRAIEHSIQLRRYLVPQGLQIDLRISNLGIVIDTSNLTESGLIRISFQVENVGNVDVAATPVEVFSVRGIFTPSGFPSYGSPYLNPLFNTTVDVATNGTQNITFEVPVRELFLRGVMVFVDPTNEMPEVPVENNMATMDLPQNVMSFNEPSDVAKDTGDETLGGMSLGFAAIVTGVVILAVIVGVVILLLREK
jgi:DNA-binding transcriptional ArsR family regulator